jgi:type II secretory pathway component PulK
MNKKRMRKIKNKGSILILVLWALGLLTVFAIYLGVGARGRIEFLDRIETRSRLYHCAEAAIKQAVCQIGNFEKEISYLALKDISSTNQEISPINLFADADFTIGYPCDLQDFSLIENESKGFMYGFCDVQSKLNINFAKRKELIDLLKEVCNISEGLADEIASSIIDWRDSDSRPLASGAEDKYYKNLAVAYNCKDSRFESIEELRYVRSMDYNIYNQIEPYITVFGPGTVNINTASAKVLKALGLDDGLADKVLDYRCGEDGIASNGDDRVFDIVSSIVARLSQVESLSASEVAQLSNIVAGGRFCTYSNYYFIRTQATVNNKKDACAIRCVFEKDLDQDSKKAGLILDWQVDYFNLADQQQSEGEYEVW